MLWYNVFGTNDAVAKLGGNPYGNHFRWYWGSSDDATLNRSLPRYWADPAALAEVKHYETSGKPGIPLVTLHTLGDEIIPYWHEALYRAKVNHTGSQATIFPIVRYGHCDFKVGSVLFAFAVLVGQVSGSQPDFSEVVAEVDRPSN
jgi:hypothetical protein